MTSQLKVHCQKAMHLIDNPNYSGNFAENFKKNLRGEISEIEE